MRLEERKCVLYFFLIFTSSFNHFGYLTLLFFCRQFVLVAFLRAQSKYLLNNFNCEFCNILLHSKTEAHFEASIKSSGLWDERKLFNWPSLIS